MVATFHEYISFENNHLILIEIGVEFVALFILYNSLSKLDSLLGGLCNESRIYWPPCCLLCIVCGLEMLQPILHYLLEKCFHGL